mgnify:CR=1 FL=1
MLAFYLQCKHTVCFKRLKVFSLQTDDICLHKQQLHDGEVGFLTGQILIFHHRKLLCMSTHPDTIPSIQSTNCATSVSDVLLVLKLQLGDQVLAQDTSWYVCVILYKFVNGALMDIL